MRHDARTSRFSIAQKPPLRTPKPVGDRASLAIFCRSFVLVRTRSARRAGAPAAERIRVLWGLERVRAATAPVSAVPPKAGRCAILAGREWRMLSRRSHAAAADR